MKIQNRHLPAAAVALFVLANTFVHGAEGKKEGAKHPAANYAYPGAKRVDDLEFLDTKILHSAVYRTDHDVKKVVGWYLKKMRINKLAIGAGEERFDNKVVRQFSNIDSSKHVVQTKSIGRPVAVHTITLRQVNQYIVVVTVSRAKTEKQTTIAVSYFATK